MTIHDDNEDKNHFNEFIRTMLPAGAPLPDQHQLDYSISVDYQPPPITIKSTNSSPFTKPIIKNSSFTKPPSKIPPKFSSLNLIPNTNPPHSTAIAAANDDDLHQHISIDLGFNQQEFDASSKSDSISMSINVTNKTQKQNHLGNDKKKKNVCSRCGKGIRLRNKEKCIVCDARYCSNCVLKAMGSMPQGRKCVSCIGLPIDESRRCKLGKCSRMLSKFSNSLEVRQIMTAEKECLANQLRPEQLVVNGSQLKGEDDLYQLLGCHLELKPGRRYWYDKDSGLWGQEGEKPDRIVSSKLNVGGKLQVDASNGNTQVYINGREITKVELKLLKLAKVQCPQGTRLWLYDDGSYEEEGQNNIKGNIWGKASTRLISSLFCLPVPYEHEHSSHGLNHEMSTLNRFVPFNRENSRVQKLMLFGLEGSGTSTILKQVRISYGNKFTTEELQYLKLKIQSNTYRYLSFLLEGREQFEEEALTEVKPCTIGNSRLEKSTECVYSINPKFKHFSDWLLDITATGDFDNYFPAASREYASLVDEIWKDAAIQETYKRMNGLCLVPDVAKYFLDQVIELSRNDYEPSENDILYAEGITPSKGLSHFDFSFIDHSPMHDEHDENGQTSPIKYQLIRVSTNGEFDNRCKWLDMLEGARVFVYCVALSDYDQLSTLNEGVTKNKMLANRDSFERLLRHPCFRDIPCVLILNKHDLFEEKIVRTPLTVCEWFRDFRPLRSQHQMVANVAYYYVAMKFKELCRSITGRKLFVCKSIGRKRCSVEETLKYVIEVIRWDEEEWEDDVYRININEDDDNDNDDDYLFAQTHFNSIN
ncbi:extra-large guanine nucleotide-binding protein 3-like [Rutidosis leptorrhynchoides]|uniref:extra-large guanine nucleotide-binding protein 3-like n=1 Tax=Rutidosis leptorrhynchoides TaxID=125765 RepID=UPI003A99DF0A